MKTTVSTTINRKKKRGPFLRVQKVYFYLQFYYFQDQEIDTFKIVKLSRSRNETEWTCFGELDLNYYFGRVKISGPWLPSQKTAKRGRGKPTLRSKTERNVTEKKDRRVKCDVLANTSKTWGRKRKWARTYKYQK